MVCEISSLQHEVLDDPVEGGALVALALLLVGQGGKVLHRLGHGAAEQADLDPARVLAADRDGEEDLLGDLGAGAASGRTLSRVRGGHIGSNWTLSRRNEELITANARFLTIEIRNAKLKS